MPTTAGFLYLSVVINVFSLLVVIWAMADHLRTKLVLDALELALSRRRPKQVFNHSDQGSQYTAIGFGSRCREAGVRPSMGSVGDCLDEAICENFFATLECELLARQRFASHQVAKSAIFEFIESFYNRLRRHSALGYQSPVDFEAKAARPSSLPAAV